MGKASDQQGENERQWKNRNTSKVFLSTYDICVSTHDISSIKRVFTRKFVKFPVVVVQQKSQRNVQKSVIAQFSCMFSIELISSTDL